MSEAYEVGLDWVYDDTDRHSDETLVQGPRVLCRLAAAGDEAGTRGKRES